MNEFKIKELSLSQIIISVDRLTRFKETEEKYLRVFKDIIASNLIYPKFKKCEIENLPYEDICTLINKIFEFSLKKTRNDTNLSINKKLASYENFLFKNSSKTQALLDNTINYDAIIPKFGKDLPYNLRWLKNLKKNINIDFPIKKIVIAEGITEEILLPVFAKKYGIDFEKEGVFVISAGGKNQVVKLFYKYADILKIPMFVLLDCDAKSNLEEIKPKLRSCDKIHLLSGEFEDLLSLNLIKRTLNRKFKNYFKISLNDLRKPEPMTKILTNLFKNFGTEFKKAEFAESVSKNIKKEDLTEELISIFNEI